MDETITIFEVFDKDGDIVLQGIDMNGERHELIVRSNKRSEFMEGFVGTIFPVDLTMHDDGSWSLHPGSHIN
jgi:hypothetical protein